MFKSPSAALADRLPYWGFVADDVVLTTSGQLLFFAEVEQFSIDGRAAEDLDRVNLVWQKLFASIEPPHRGYLLFRRTPMAVPEDFEGRDDVAGLAQRKRLSYVCNDVRRMQTVLVVAYDPQLRTTVDAQQAHWLVGYLRTWLRERTSTQHLSFLLQQDLDEAVADCRSSYQMVSTLVSDRTPLRPLAHGEIGELLHFFVNQGQGVFVPSPRPQRYGLNWRLSGDALVFERSHMEVGARTVGLFSLALPPAASAANSLGDLYSLKRDLSVVLEWRGIDRYLATGRIRAVQKHANNMRWSLWSAVNETEGSDMAIEDASSGAAVEQLHRAMLELDTHNIPFGEFALSIAAGVDDRKDLDEFAAEVHRVFLHQDGKVVHERFGQPSVWFERFPGQAAAPLPRPVFVSSGQAAALSPIFGVSRGYSRCAHLDKPPLTWFKTRCDTPYGYDLFGGADVGHTVVFGATGSGKSFSLNFLLTQALQYNPRVVILDLGGSYRWITKFLGGRYISMKPTDSGSGVFRRICGQN